MALMLYADNVGVEVQKNVLLHAMSLSIAAGECVAILGPNGAGKSTLLSCLSGERKPTSGRVALDDVPLHQWLGFARAQRIAVLPQAVELSFPMRVWEVIALGRSPYGDEHKTYHWQRDAMQLTGVWSLRERRYPSLSGGEQQRVQLARVLLQIWEARIERHFTSPYFLLLDECTSALDPTHQHAIMSVVKTFANAGVGVCAVMHDISLAASWADRVLLLKNGRLRAEGSVEILSDTKQLQQVYDLSPTLARAYAAQNGIWEAVKDAAPQY
ncbi:heme ABC transporter ATP-binding protein [Thalassolituus oleivorans]|uniref:heme ABC transporter ATP-binding protein n=1 Tax=Thalassolituus oleivorans TaxID=187493 RepID=UPI003C6F25E5